ncbi:helix-turn-helix domain-containing protein [Saccharomonospora sp. NB11]|uniref:PucR family transcriptional regulator n=1 Tax=Saccharomonospora sp. NB11 TaxID=1642298 RepID=UPI0027DD2DA9|nr:helix-turn-helix domain-containing protein [Saccharomonospora sp. NB11]
MQQQVDARMWLAEVATALADRVEELTGTLLALYEREVPHLVHDDEAMVTLLSASVFANIDTALRMFQRGLDPDRVQAPAAAVEYARRLAQRGTPVSDLVRAYYLGQAAVLETALAEGTARIPEAKQLGHSLRHAVSTTFRFIDGVTRQVMAVYEEERGRWLLNRSAVRATRVRAVLDGDVTEIGASEAALGYRLRGDHVGLVAWYPEHPEPKDPLAELEVLAHRVGRAATSGDPLFVPHDELTAWVWLPLSTLDVAEVERQVSELDSEVRVALGDPAHGVEGFRTTHRQAVRVQALALAAGKDSARVLAFSDVGAVALMTSDLPSARTWVEYVLGRLASDEPTAHRLRTTLRVFLETGSSYTAAAGLLGLHKNSVQYRVRKAEELLAVPLATRRLDVELALKLCDRLGGAVLTRQ